MPGEVDKLARHPLSFYGSTKSTDGYCTRQSISRQQIGTKLGLKASSNKLILYSRMNGRKLRRNPLTFGSSNKIPVTMQQNASKLAPRHCRYFNMQVRRLPRHQFANGSLNGLSGSKLPATGSLNGLSGSKLPATGSAAARPPNESSTVKTSSLEKALVKSRESRVLISAELKNKADSKMKNIMSVNKFRDLARDKSRNGGSSSHKNVRRSDEVKKTQSHGAVLKKFYDKGLQLRNGRSLPECKDIKQEKSVIHNVCRQSSGNECAAKIKKYRVLYRSRSLSPVKPLALSRPRRNANIKRSDIAGMSWREELDIRRALNASIRHSTSRQDSCSSTVNGENGCASGQQSVNGFEGHTVGSIDLSEDGTRSSVTTNADLSDRPIRVRAQRKFASSSSVASSPCGSVMYNRAVSSPSDWSTVDQSPLPAVHKLLAGRRVTTDDFLTFLCLRGSPKLPPHLEMFNHVEATSMLCDSTSITSDVSSSTDDRDTLSQDIARDLGVTPLNATPDKTSLGTATGEHDKFTPHKSSPARSASRRLSSSKQLDNSQSPKSTASSKCLQSSAAKRLQYSTSSVSDSVSGSTSLGFKSPLSQIRDELQPATQAGTTAIQRSPLHSPRRTVNGKLNLSDAGDSHDVFPNRTLEVNHSSTEVVGKATQVTRSPKVIHRSPKVANRSAEIIRSPRQRQSVSGSAVKRGRLESPAGQPKTKKYIVERLRNAKTSRKKSVDTAASNKSSPVRTKSPQKYTGKTLVARNGGSSVSVEAGEIPTYRPTAEQFDDVIAYIESISAEAQRYGMCRIIPPPDSRKVECCVSENLRFASQTQYVHRLRDRWGPNAVLTACIRRHIEKQGGKLDTNPLVSGLETDLAKLWQAVESLGGLQQVIDKHRWNKVVEMLKIPKIAREKTSRLYEIFCKQLLSFSSLSTNERHKLEKDVDQQRNRSRTFDVDPCVSKGRSKSLSEFFYTARNATSMYFSDEPSTADVEREYWKLVNERTHHVAVQSACVVDDDSAAKRRRRSGNRDRRTMSEIQQSSCSLLQYLHQQIPGVTVPQLHVGMLFSTVCWSRNEHFLPTLHYLHTGADVIWYSVDASQANNLKRTMLHLAPDLINADESEFWLPPDSVMVSPDELRQVGGMHVRRTVQQQGQFVVVFPQCFTASVDCGYNISEYIHFASLDWLPVGRTATSLLSSASKDEEFSMDELLVILAHSSPDTRLVPHLNTVIQQELDGRRLLSSSGVRRKKLSSRRRKDSAADDDDDDDNDDDSDDDLTDINDCRCQLCHKICYLSAVVNEGSETVYCAADAAARLKQHKSFTANTYQLIYRLDDAELRNLVDTLKSMAATETNVTV